MTRFVPGATTSCGRKQFSLERATSPLWCIVLTLDKDFRPIAVPRRNPLEQSGIVLFRVHPAAPERLAPLMDAFAAADSGWAGPIRITTVLKPGVTRETLEREANKQSDTGSDRAMQAMKLKLFQAGWQ